MIGKKDFFVPNLFAKISKKRVITKKWRFFIVQCVKKVSLRKKVENGTKKESIKLAWHYFFTIFAKNKEISKNYTYYIITL